MSMLRAISAAAAAACLALTASCSREPKWHYDEGAAWGTLYHISYLAPESMHDSVRAVMRAVELSVSPFEPQSRISAVNAGRTDTLDIMLAELAARSQSVCSISSGAFDPTVMPLVDLWGFGPGKKKSDAPPSAQAIDSALAAVGIRDSRVTPERVFVRKHPDTRLDFSAIAKGMGVDEVARMLARNGVDRYMVEIGGEVAVGGLSPSESLWRIQIDTPVDDPTGTNHRRMCIASLHGGRAVATSGNYRNYRLQSDGTRAVHIIDPRTGRPSTSTVLSATVVAGSCMLADALATAAMNMQPDSALAMAGRLPGVEMLLAVAEADTFRIAATPAFPADIPR